MDRIKLEAQTSGFFDKVLCHDESKLPTSFLDYAKRNPRGYGFWRWKHMICGGIIDNINLGDYLVYADAGCAINPYGNMKRWLEIADEKGMVSFELGKGMTERKYTKMETMKKLNLERFIDTPQLMSTIFVAKRTRSTTGVLDYARSCAMNMPEIYDDYTENEDPEFVDHRHDQSVFSLLRKLYEFESIPDETYHDGHGNYNPMVPIWATRRR